MPNINLRDVSEFEAHRFSTEASSLRWPVGYFPSEVATDLGNQQPLQLQRMDDYVAVYQQQAGCVQVLVYND
jgi:hypothetical protein